MEWLVSHNLVAYPDAVREMEARVASIRAGDAQEAVWLVEHPPLYTAGTSAKADDLLQADFPVYQTGRGGQYTYHGPGQRVAYVMLDLKKRDNDIRRYVYDLEEWLIQTLQIFNVTGRRIAGRVGIWVGEDRDAAKIAAIGVRVRHGVTYHGVALNVNPDLGHFNGIIPCGISDAGVTSLHALGIKADFVQLDAALKQAWKKVFQ